jgi:glycerophosphoryl diester phosphodiesterase
MQIYVWTVNDERQIRRLAEAGVDGLITDVPDVAVRALGR